MTDVLVRNASEFSAALNAVKAGDTIRLAPGAYGDVSIVGRTFAQDVTITSMDASNPAELRSLTIDSSSGVNVLNVDVEFSPNLATVSYTPAIKISSSQDITIKGGVVHGGPAITGVLPTALDDDATGNVLGLPTGRAVSMQWSSDIRIEDLDISGFHKGVVLYKTSNVVIRNNDIEDMRTGLITGSQVSNAVIEGNTLSSSHPWNWGFGDHADFIHFWTDPNQGAPSTNIRIVDNRIDQGDGVPILGIYLDDNGNNVGFSNVTIQDNVLLNGHAFGVRAENLFNSTIAENVFLRTSGTYKNAPGIYLTDKTHDVAVYGNVTGFIKDVEGTNAGDIGTNVLVQREDPAAAGYYTLNLIDRLRDMDPLTANDFVRDLLGTNTGNPDPAGGSGGGETTDPTAPMKLTAKSSEDTALGGGSGSDTLSGLAGNDTLNGGAGNDFLIGNGGADRLVGGSGADRFVFHKTYAGTGMDTVVDFSHTSGDKIDLSGLDANSRSLTTNEAFKFIGSAAFSGAGAEVRYVTSGSDVVVYGDVNGDRVADFSIKLAATSKLLSDDFLL